MDQDQRLSKNLSFGIFLPPLPTWAAIRERARLIESLGYDSLWMLDHFVNPFDIQTPWMEAWALLAAVAASTHQIRVGTLVTNIIYRNPALIAKQALTVDHISNGRLVLGMGAGSAADLSHPMTGVPAWPNGERVSRFKETVTIVDRMLRNPETTYQGKYYQLQGAVMLPPPVQRPRPALLIGAQGPRMVRIAAQYADNWNTLGNLRCTDDEVLTMFKANRARLMSHAVSLGRDPERITCSMCVGWTHEHPYASVGAFQDYISPYIEAGITEFMLGYWKDDDLPNPAPIQHIPSEATLEWIAGKAIPSLRSWVRAI